MNWINAERESLPPRFPHLHADKCLLNGLMHFHLKKGHEDCSAEKGDICTLSLYFYVIDIVDYFEFNEEKDLDTVTIYRRDLTCGKTSVCGDDDFKIPTKDERDILFSFLKENARKEFNKKWSMYDITHWVQIKDPEIKEDE